MRIAFVFKYSKNIGGGHFWRCFNFAQKLKSTTNQIFFISNLKKSSTYYKLLKKQNFQYLYLPQINDSQFLNNLKKIIKAYHIPYIICDIYNLKASTEKKILKLSRKLVIIDDRVNKSHSCDLLINNNFLENKTKKKIFAINKKPELAIGHNYNILGPKIKNPKKTINKINKIFVFFGSADFTNETLKILKIVKFFKNLKFNLVIGDLNKNYNKICKIAKNFKNVKIYYALKNNDLIKLMVSSDLAIGAGGINLIERIYYNIPSIVISIANNQINNINFLKNKGAIIYLGKSEKVTENNIKLKIMKIIENKKAFNFLRKRIKRISLSLRDNNKLIKKLNKVFR